MDDLTRKRKDRKKIIVVAMVLAVVMVVGTSYALWQLTFTQSGTNIIVTGCLNLTIRDDTDAITLNEAVPMNDTEGKTLAPYTFTITNTCNTETKYVVNLETVTEGDKPLNDEYVKANLLKGTSEVFSSRLLSEHINEEKVIKTASVAYMLDQGVLKDKEKVTYSLRLWIADDVSDVENMMDATFASKITLTATYVPKKVINEKELYNIVAKQASLDNTQSEFVTSSTGIDFGVAPSDTNGKGVYTIADTKDYEYPVHYFRGVVENNNVKFANFCWKIVRTTETGGVKLIYNGTPNGDGGCTNTMGEETQIGMSKFNKDSRDPDYVGYMNPETTNTYSSIIKEAIDDWYSKNMIAYTSHLEDTVWCDDRSIYESYEFTIIYQPYVRNTELHKPSIVCPNDNDKFTVNSKNGNGKLTYPVALLTADEVTLAGQGKHWNSNSNYLYTNQDWWVLSLSHVDITSTGMGTIYGFYISSDGALTDYYSYIDREYGVRPSISLAPGVVVGDSGDGTQANPYEVVTQ